MNTLRFVGIAPLVAGVLGLLDDNPSYTKETHVAKIGPAEQSVKDKETVNRPVRAGGRRKSPAENSSLWATERFRHIVRLP
jgi:hypothetical protein